MSSLEAARLSCFYQELIRNYGHFLHSKWKMHETKAGVVRPDVEKCVSWHKEVARTAFQLDRVEQVCQVLVPDGFSLAFLDEKERNTLKLGSGVSGTVLAINRCQCDNKTTDRYAIKHMFVRDGTILADLHQIAREVWFYVFLQFQCRGDISLGWMARCCGATYSSHEKHASLVLEQCGQNLDSYSLHLASDLPKLLAPAQIQVFKGIPMPTRVLSSRHIHLMFAALTNLCHVGLLHGDAKPDQFLLRNNPLKHRNEWQVALVDFGFAGFFRAASWERYETTLFQERNEEKPMREEGKEEEEDEEKRGDKQQKRRSGKPLRRRGLKRRPDGAFLSSQYGWVTLPPLSFLPPKRHEVSNEFEETLSYFDIWSLDFCLWQLQFWVIDEEGRCKQYGRVSESLLPRRVEKQLLDRTKAMTATLHGPTKAETFDSKVVPTIAQQREAVWLQERADFAAVGTNDPNLFFLRTDNEHRRKEVTPSQRH